MKSHSPVAILLLVSLCLLTAAAPLPAGDDWKPVDPAHFAMKTPMVEKDADAEAIFWEVRVNDEDLDTVLTHYIRIKVFTERGREEHSKVDITYFDNTKIRDIAGRTIKPDGTIIELKKDAVFDRTIVRASGLKVKAKSFAMPSVEPGAIIEYRWREVRSDQMANYVRLHFQRDFPVQQVKYYIKPFSNPAFPYGMRAQTFHAQASPFVKEKNGFVSTQMTNVPAFREEPHMPPENQVRPWMLIYYSEDKNLAPDKYWKDLGKRVYEMFKSEMKVNDEVRKAAATAIGDATTPEQKLERLFNFCRAQVKNVNDDASGLTEADRAKLKDNKSPADTLKRGMGTSFDISMLFGALATAAGFDARYALLADRSDIFFDPSFTDTYFLRTYDIAVKVGNDWRFFDPGSTYIPFGMLPWREEGQPALITDPKEPVFVKTPISPPEKSLQKRTAKLRLSEEGTLEGEVRIEYTGHFAAERKELNDDDSPEQREQNLRDMIKRRMSTVEFADIRIENVTDPVKPFVYSFRARVPGYAQRTGKRLFLQPAFFQRGIGALFPTSQRKHDIYFNYPWREEDVVIIELPEGYALDNAEAPAPFSVGQTGNYDVKLGVTPDGRRLEYQRIFHFNGMLFPASSYPQLKLVFDALHERDNHTVSLKQTAASSN
jgi:hypothetical protein